MELTYRDIQDLVNLAVTETVSELGITKEAGIVKEAELEKVAGELMDNATEENWQYELEEDMDKYASAVYEEAIEDSDFVEYYREAGYEDDDIIKIAEEMALEDAEEIGNAI